MAIHRKFGFILLVIFPFSFLSIAAGFYYIWISTSMLRDIVNTQLGYSQLENTEIIEEISKKTIYIIPKVKISLAHNKPEEWIFNPFPEVKIAKVQESDMDNIELKKDNHMNLDGKIAKIRSVVLRKSGYINPDDDDKVVQHIEKDDIRLERRIKIKQKEKEGEIEEDPFLAEWSKSKQDSLIALNTTTSPVEKITNGGKKSNHKESNLVRDKIKENKSENKTSDTIIEDGKEKTVSLLNVTENRYLNYTSVEGRVEQPSVDHTEYFSEISFYDRVGEDGLETEASTILASQEIRDVSQSFSLRLPVESQGYLIAKMYASEDIDKKNPLYIGMFDKNPLVVSKEGVQGLLVSLVSKTKYLSKFQTVFNGKILNEYVSDSQINGIPHVSVWVSGMGQRVVSDDKGNFEIKGLLKSSDYHFILEKEDFMTVQIPVTMNARKAYQIFTMSPVSKFTRGYDILLGQRDPSQAILFATVTKQGRPLSQAIIKTTQNQKVIYERETDLMTFPDSTLFSTRENGKFILWNVKAGRNKIDIYHDGKLLGSQTVKFSPDIVHQMTFNF